MSKYIIPLHITSRKRGFGSGLASPLASVLSWTGTHGGIRPGSCAQGAGRASWGICPDSFGEICPGSRHEPGPMGLAPDPQPLIPVCEWNRNERVAISTGSSQEPGPMIWLYIPLAGEQSTPLVLYFLLEGKGRLSGALAYLQCTWCGWWNARATLLKLSPLQTRPPSSIFLKICLGLAVRHVVVLSNYSVI